MRNKILLYTFLGLGMAATALLGQIPAAPAAGATMVGDTPLDDVAFSTIQASGEKFWVGEVFTLTHKVSAARRVFQTLGEGFDWNTPGLNVEDWTPLVPSDSRVNGEPWVTYTQTSKAYSRTAGRMVLPTAAQPIVLITGTTRSDLTTQTASDTFSLKTKTPSLEFRPLPTPAPMTFYGAVGDFNLTSRVASNNVAVGESITWTLELTGTGSWPEIHGLPGRAVSKDFTIVKPVSKLTLNNGTLFAGTLTEDVLLVPTKAGTYQLGPMRYTYFDTKLGKYQMITTETIMVTVGGSTTPGAPATPVAEGQAKSDSGLVAERTPVAESPAALPLDPLPGSSNGMVPFTWKHVRNIAILPIVLLAAFWLKLSADRRRLTDPMRSRREARAAIARTLQKLDPAGEEKPKPEVVREQIYRWQQATARYWALSHPVPQPNDLAEAVARLGSPSEAPAWLELWRESNITLHGKTAALVGGWTARARKALQAAPLAEPPLHAVFLARNLLPFASILFFALMLAPAVHADPANDAYGKGDFATAEKLWLAAVKESPRDPIARYNLALAEAQQDRWSEATAQSLAAFCLDPGNKAIRSQFKLALERSGIDHPLVTALANRESFFKIAGVFSPAQWDLILIFSSVIAALAIGFILWTAYSESSHGARWPALVVAALAVLAAVTAELSIKRYGLLADRSIAVVAKATLLRSVPTELGTNQKMAPLPAGSMGAVDRVFLGWSRMVFPNGQTGWVRSDSVVHLYE